MADEKDEKQNQNPPEKKSETPETKTTIPETPRSTQIVQGDGKTVRELQERLARMEQSQQERSEEISGLRKLVDQIGRLSAPDVRPKKKGEKSLLETVNDLVFGPFEKEDSKDE